MKAASKKLTSHFLLLTVLTLLMIVGCSPSHERTISSEGPQLSLVENSQLDSEEITPLDTEGASVDTEEGASQDAQESTSQSSEGSFSQDSEVRLSSQQEAVFEEESIPVLYYHSIDYEKGNELRIPAQEFETHMQFLRENGYESITLNQLYQHFYEGKELPDKPFVLTFDDGYEDNYHNAFPIAEKYGYTGTIFMVTNWIDGKGYLKREQLIEMVQKGWQIESHTMTHPYLNGISEVKIKEELINSKKVLEELLQVPVNALAYPYGAYDSTVIASCKEVGYKMGLTTERGWADSKDPFRIKRIYCYAQMGVPELKRRIENADY